MPAVQGDPATLTFISSPERTALLNRGREVEEMSLNDNWSNNRFTLFLGLAVGGFLLLMVISVITIFCVLRSR